MASLTNVWKLVICLHFAIPQSFVHSAASLTINATSVKVGYLLEHPRLENSDTSEAVVDKNLIKGALSLICDISPPLPSDGEHWEKRNQIVKWVKLSPKSETVESVRYWSSDMTKTAIRFLNITLDALGSYSCSYGGLSASIDVLVANVEAAETLRKPSNLLELKTYITFMKDKSGLSGWSNDHSQALLTPIGTKEQCPQFEKSQQTSQSVHQLHVSDIRVVAAMGDAFTVGLGARSTSLNDFFTDYKDISWSIGGGDHLNQSTTLPNVIKQFSPSLKGASMESSEIKPAVVMSDLNVAFVGASTRDLEDQAKDLVSRLKNMKDIDYQNDWKLVTIWIGTEDLCQVCRDKDTYSPGLFIKYVMRTLSYLQQEVPRLFVNLIPAMDVTSLHQLHEGDSTSCQILGWNSCECLATNADIERQKISEAAREYKRLLEELVNSGLYDTQEDFTVVIQPAMYNPPTTRGGQVVKAFFGLDCLHFTVKGHAAAALTLWQNMLEPYGTKTEEWGDGATLKCPLENKPYLFTKENSNTVRSQMSASDNDDDDTDGFPPTAAVALAVCFTAVVVIVVVVVWRSRRSRRRPEALKLLYAPGPQRPRI